MRSESKNTLNISTLIIIFGLSALMIGIIILILLPEIRVSAWMLLGFAAIMFIIAFIINFSRYIKAITGRRGKFGMSAVLMSSIFFGIIILLNAISGLYSHRFDTSRLSQFSLSPQTVKALSGLKNEVKITGFFVPEDPYNIGTYIKDLLNEYENKSGKLTVSMVDPDQHPDQAKKYGITEYQTVIFESSGRRKTVPPSKFLLVDESGNPAGVKAEYSFTSAILEVTGVSQKTVYFLTGHGDDIESNFTKAAEGLLNDLYILKRINLKTDPDIPSDCAVLIIAGMRTNLSEKENEVINGYLKNGGQALILTDPDSRSGLDKLLSKWGVTVKNGTVIDPASSVDPHDDMPLVPSERNYFYLPEVYFPGAAAIIPQEKIPADIQMVPLVYTDKSSWLDTNYTSGKEAVYNPGIEKKESLAIGILISKTPASGFKSRKTTRLIAIGDSDFATNKHFDNANNADLFLNSVSWLAEETSLISIHRNIQPFRSLILTPAQTNFIRYSSAALFPFLLLIAGGVIWWRRR